MPVSNLMLECYLAKVDGRVNSTDPHDSPETGRQQLERVAVEIARWALERDRVAWEMSERWNRIIDIVEPWNMDRNLD